MWRKDIQGRKFYRKATKLDFSQFLKILNVLVVTCPALSIFGFSETSTMSMIIL